MLDPNPEAERVLDSIASDWGITPSQQRAYLNLLGRDHDLVLALESVIALIASSHTEPSREQVARAGLEWLDDRLADYHVTIIEKPIRKLAAAGCDAIEIAETLNDAGYDELNGGQEIGEVHVRRVAKRLGIELANVRWR